MLKALLVLTAAAAGFVSMPAAAQGGSAGFAQAAEMSSVWKSQPVRQSGVYERGQYTFVVAAVQSKGLGEIRFRQQASLLAGKILFREAARRAFRGKLSAIDEALLDAASGTLNLETRQIYSSRSEGLLVLGMKTADFERQAKKMEVGGLLKNQLKKIALSPQQAEPGFFKRLELRDLERLNRIIRNKEHPADSRLVVKTEASAAELVLLCKSVTTLENQQVNAAYRDIAWPTLRAVMNAEGFVRFSATVRSDRPAIMDEVLRRFASGRELSLVVYLLESATEVSPANSQVWEYLEAAYRAQGEREKALVAARVWYLLGGGDRRECFKRLLADQASSAGERFLQYMKDKKI